MGYNKQYWANGDLITAAKLNHMEDGIAEGGSGSGGGALVINVNPSGDPIGTTLTLDKTAGEIIAAFPNVYAKVTHSDPSEIVVFPLCYIPSSGMYTYKMPVNGSGVYRFTLITGVGEDEDTYNFIAGSVNDYPVANNTGSNTEQ